MKWCVLLNNSDIADVLGRFSQEIVRHGDECVVLANSKVAEWGKLQHFPKEARIISLVDWSREHFKEDQTMGSSLSWKDIYPAFARDEGKVWHGDYTASVKITNQIYQWIDSVLQTERPDVVIHEPPSGISSGILYHLSRKHGIPYLGFNKSKFSDRIDVFDERYTCSQYRKHFQELGNTPLTKEQKDSAKHRLDMLLSYQRGEIQRNTRSYVYRLRRMFQLKKNLISVLIKYLFHRGALRKFDYESEDIFWRNIRYPFTVGRRMLRRVRQKRLFSQHTPAEKFFLFPLQFKLESSVHVYATYFSDQLCTVKNVAFSLPFPYKLYVKEHPGSFGDRTTEFYRQLKDIPNVVLIPPKENILDLIERSEGVITLTSTVGIEAALLGKPVYVFGDVFYTYHPMCRSVSHFEELRQRIAEDMNNPSFPPEQNRTDINERFMLSYVEHTFPWRPVTFEEKDINDYGVIYRGVKKSFFGT